eukprot:COSAG02_NODE_735_length_17872_cov_20.966860_3_plen_187_part_00
MPARMSSRRQLDVAPLFSSQADVALYRVYGSTLVPRQRSPLTLVGGVCLHLLSLAAVAGPLTPPAKPNLLFINVDDLRPSIGAFGQPFMHTPHFDAFAERAVLFTRAYAVAPHCLPSRNAYMTGRRPDTSHVWSGGGLMNFRTLGPDWVTLPSFFRDQGYTAVGQGKVSFVRVVVALSLCGPFINW